MSDEIIKLIKRDMGSEIMGKQIQNVKKIYAGY